MSDTRHFGLIGGLGVGAAVLYYQEIVRMCAEQGRITRLTLAHANAPTALAHVQAGRIAGLADYLAGFLGELKQAGASLAAIPAITPHICRAELRERIPNLRKQEQAVVSELADSGSGRFGGLTCHGTPDRKVIFCVRGVTAHPY